MLVRKTPILLAILSTMLAVVTTCAQQQQPQTDAGPVAGESYSRETILQSQRWRRLRRQFDEWLSVQKIYTPAQVAELTTALERHVASMPTSELEDFIDDTEERLAVLTSDKAMDARSYLSFFTDEGRRQRIANGGEIPNVFNITVGQLRQELNQFQQQRAARSANQAAFNQSREQSVTAIAEQRSARQDANLQMREQAMRDARQQRDTSFTSPYALRREIPFETRGGLGRSLYVTPWGGISTRYTW